MFKWGWYKHGECWISAVHIFNSKKERFGGWLSMYTCSARHHFWTCSTQMHAVCTHVGTTLYNCFFFIIIFWIFFLGFDNLKGWLANSISVTMSCEERNTALQLKDDDKEFLWERLEMQGAVGEEGCGWWAWGRAVGEEGPGGLNLMRRRFALLAKFKAGDSSIATRSSRVSSCEN